MEAIPRIDPETTRRKMEAGEGLLLVCAYEEEEKFQKTMLEGAISLQAFRNLAPSLPKGREIVFYCA